MTSDAHNSADSEARILAVILNYRTPELSIDCLRTLLPELDPELDRVIVVDNASGDDSAARIAAELRNGPAHARLIESPVNGGFAAGNNVGIRAVKARAYLLLNSDTLLRPGAPEILWQTLSSAPDVGIVSPRLEWPDGEPQISCFRLPSPLSEVIGGSETGLVRKLLDPWDIPIDVQDEVSEPEWTSFAAVMIRRQVIERVGLLDEDFFMYFEDVDYCRMTRAAGFRVLNQPRARVVHLRGQSSPVKRLQAALKRRPAYYYRSRALYFRKAYGVAGELAANACWTFGRGISFARELVGNKQPHTVERELVDIWRTSLERQTP